MGWEWREKESEKKMRERCERTWSSDERAVGGGVKELVDAVRRYVEGKGVGVQLVVEGGLGVEEVVAGLREAKVVASAGRRETRGVRKGVDVVVGVVTEGKGEVKFVSRVEVVPRVVVPAVTEIGGLRVVRIGAQTWTAANVALGEDADEVRGETWPDRGAAVPRHAWCYYDNDKKNEMYGRLYTRSDLYRRTICPRLWRIPQTGDWVTLLRACGATVVVEENGYVRETSVTNVDTALTELQMGAFKALLGGTRYEQEFSALGVMQQSAVLEAFSDGGYDMCHIKFALASWAYGDGKNGIRRQVGGDDALCVRLIAEDVLGGLVCAQVGTQVWTAESLDVDVAGVVQAQDDGEWAAAARAGKPAWCYHRLNERNTKKWGRLYNAAALAEISRSKKLTKLWRVPTAADWGVLYRYYSGVELGDACPSFDRRRSGVPTGLADAVRALEAPPFRADLGGSRVVGSSVDAAADAAFWYASGVMVLDPVNRMMVDKGHSTSAGEGHSVRLIKRT
jgi:uncharacterized protein (TIGR02145 family)